MSSADKFIEGLTLLLEGYLGISSKVASELNSELEEEDEEPNAEEFASSLITEIRTLLESFMDSDEYPAEEVALVLSGTASALEDIEPDIFDSLDFNPNKSELGVYAIDVEDDEDYYEEKLEEDLEEEDDDESL